MQYVISAAVQIITPYELDHLQEQVLCLCEGGRHCTREDPAKQKGLNAVPGLHSNWVGEHVLAMARPWQHNVIKHDLVNKFQELNIGMVLNLQEVGA
jgi:protein tyrosine phosphatase domain-containing protein 1